MKREAEAVLKDQGPLIQAHNLAFRVSEEWEERVKVTAKNLHEGPQFGIVKVANRLRPFKLTI